MKITRTPLNGLLVIEPDCFKDERGFFLETYQEQRYKEVGIIDRFVQDNHSRSVKCVLRGMHYQIKHPQAQIITVMRGHIFDVGVDLRSNSETFGQWYGIELNDTGGPRQVYMAPGFAHGFCVMSDYADLHYKVSRFYDLDDEGGLLWNDPNIGIQWPPMSFHVSSRDSCYPRLKDNSGEINLKLPINY